MSVRTKLLGVVEPFLLLDAARVSARLSDSQRGAAGRALLIARQRRRAAETLWWAGHRAEGLRLMRDALGRLAEAVAAASPAMDGEAVDVDSALRRLDVDPDHLALARTAADAADLDVPRLDAELGAPQRELFGRLAAAFRALEPAVAGAALTRAGLWWTRVGRALAVIGGGLLLAGIVAAYTHEPRRILATASNQQRQWPALDAVDGNPMTEWQMHDRRAGHLDVLLEPPRRVKAIRFLNMHNRHYNDRATKAYRIEVYSGTERLQTEDGVFETLDPDPEWRRIEVGHDDVDRIRFVVRTYHQMGGGLAELEVVEEPDGD